MNEPAPFDFGLSEADESRAERLHSDAIVIDLLYQGPLGASAFTPQMDELIRNHWDATHDLMDTFFKAVEMPVNLAVHGELDSFRQSWLESGVTCGTREVELSDMNRLAQTFAAVQVQFDTFDWLRKALTANDIRSAKEAGHAAGLISTQLGMGPFPTLEILEHAIGLGIRMVQLTYNSMTHIAGGCMDRTDAGVSRFGESAIRMMNDSGVIVDIAHCGRQTTMDACELSSRPVVASHTAVDALHSHDRSKSDEEIKAIAGTGGVVGIVTVPFFLRDGARPTLNDFLDHIDYVSNLVGHEHVAIGTDWPMQMPKWTLQELFAGITKSLGFRSEHAVDPLDAVVGFEDYREFPNFSRGLVSRGYTDEQVLAILGGNALRVIEDCCG